MEDFEIRKKPEGIKEGGIQTNIYEARYDINGEGSGGRTEETAAAEAEGGRRKGRTIQLDNTKREVGEPATK